MSPSLGTSRPSADITVVPTGDRFPTSSNYPSKRPSLRRRRLVGIELAIVSAMRHGHVVVTFSRQPSVADFMKRFLDEAGYAAVACWSTVEDLERAIRDQSPGAVVYEVGYPLDSEWKAFCEARRRPAFAHLPFVVATPAPPNLYQRLGISHALAIFTRPSNDEIETALRTAIDTAARVSDAA